MKNDFQSQIDSYNNSIDNKIDGAIASYLAGIKLSSKEEKIFYDGNETVLVFYDDEAITSAKPLKQGLWGLDLVHMFTNISRGNSFGNSSWTIKWKRPNDKTEPFELFGMKFVSTDNYVACFYSNDIKMKYTHSLSMTINPTDYSPYVNQSFGARYGWRWWANYNNRNTKAVPSNNEISSGTDLGSNTADGCSNMPMDPKFWKYYATLWNTGMSMGSGAAVSTDFSEFGKAVTYVYSTDIINDYTKYNLFCTNRETSAKMWIDNAEPYKINNFKSCYWGAELYNGGNKLSYYTPVRKTSASTSNDTGISTKIWALQKGNSGENHDVLFDYANLTWQLAGGANESTYNPSMISANDYYEWIPITKSIANKNLYNDINTLILGAFASYGFSGRVGEGIPVTILESNQTNLDFSIDTSPLGENVVIGLKDSPFSFDGSVALENETISSKISSLKIDGVDNGTSASKVVTPGVHNISIAVSGDTNVPIFFKIAWARSSNNSKRGLFKLPKTVTITKST